MLLSESLLAQANLVQLLELEKWLHPMKLLSVFTPYNFQSFKNL
jgi:hypothetical protein